MAEIATIARPYAEALFKAANGQTVGLVEQLDALATLTAYPDLRSLAENPKVAAEQAETLATAWRFATRVRNATMLVRDKPTDQLPSMGADLAAVADVEGTGGVG